jgi:hypothetical protein
MEPLDDALRSVPADDSPSNDDPVVAQRASTCVS